jgi:hypothetical protein
MRTKWIDRLSDYSDESIFAELRRIAKSLGRPLTMDDVESAKVSYGLLKKRYGGLRQALKLAGQDAPEFHRNVRDEDLLRELERVWDSVLAKEGRRPFKDDLSKYGAKYSYGPYYRRWGSWIRACEAVLEWSDKKAILGERLTSAEPSILRSPRKKTKRAIPLRLRYEILKRDNFRCTNCGRSPSNTPGLALHVDHFTAESRDGPTTKENLRTLCGDCNLGKGDLDEGPARA